MADNLDPEYLRDLEASLQASREAVDNWTTEMLSGRRETGLERDARRSNNQALAEEKKRRDELNQALSQFKTQFLGASSGFGKALLSTEGGMSKYNASLKTASTGLADLAGSFGVFGKAIGGIIKVISFAVETVTEGNEKLIKSYNDLGEIGAAASITTSDLLKFAETAGYGTRNLEGLIKPVKSLGSGLIALGGSTGEGIKKFAQLAATTEEQRAAYRRLGFSQEEVTQLQADYIRTTTNAGLTLARSVEKQRKGADEYIESLTVLAALTGTTIKQQQEARDKALAQENFNAYLFAKGIERDKLQAQADATLDKTKKAELQARADEVGRVIQAKTAFGQLAMSTRDAKAATGLLQLAASKNGEVYTEQSAYVLASGFNFKKLNDALERGEDGFDIYMEETTRVTKKFTDEFGESAYAYGQASIELQKTFGIDNDARRLAAIQTNRNTEAGKKAYEEEKARYKAKMSDEAAAKDPTLKAENARLEAEKKTKEAMDSLYKLIQGPVNTALTAFADALTSMVDWIADTFKLDIGSKEDQTRRRTKKEIKELTSDVDRLSRLDPTSLTQGGKKELQTKKDRLEVLQGRDPNQSNAEANRLGLAASSSVTSVAGSTGTGAAGGAAVANTAAGGAGENNRPQGFTDRMYQSLLLAAKSAGVSNPEAIAKLGTAQSALETGYGKHAPNNNYFGIKDFRKDSTTAALSTQEFINGKMVTIKDKFMTYSSMEESAADYIRFLQKNSRYKGVLAANSFEEAVSAQAKTGYATDPDYGAKLMAISAKIPQARAGGIFSGSNMGFPVELHGNELVAPLDPNSILAKMLTASPSEAAAMMPNTGSSGVSTEMIEAMINKFDTMISYLSEGVDIQQKILRQS
jgi:flagellum-specific peptidoglycan hydrolase FlgJ